MASGAGGADGGKDELLALVGGNEKHNQVLRDCLLNLIHDTVLDVHRKEKQAHMRSATVIAQQAKERAKEEASPGGEPQEVVTTGATVTGDDRVMLKGNPFTTAPEVLCPTCRLPRLHYPTTGKNSRPPDSSKEYCTKHPYIQKDGCDIYGKSLTLEKPSKKSKAQRAADAKNSKPDPSPNGDGSGSDEDGGGGGGNSKTDNKPAATSIPSGKCPNCPRYMAYTRIAQHLDRCLGLSGRAAGKNAMNKLSGSQGTPQSGSRASTPKPTASGTPNPPGSGNGNAEKGSAASNGTTNKKRKLERNSDDDDEDGATASKATAGNEKKKKKLTTNKKASNPSVQRIKGSSKPPGRGRSSSPQTKKEDDSD